MDNNKDKGKENNIENKDKVPTYKLQFKIESLIDMKDTLQERILDVKIEFILRKALGISKKDFYEFIINLIKRKRQMIVETILALIMWK